MRLMQNLVLKKINLVLIFEPKGTRPARLDTLVNVSTFFLAAVTLYQFLSKIYGHGKRQGKKLHYKKVLFTKIK